MSSSSFVVFLLITYCIDPKVPRNEHVYIQNSFHSSILAQIRFCDAALGRRPAVHVGVVTNQASMKSPIVHHELPPKSKSVMPNSG